MKNQPSEEQLKSNVPGDAELTEDNDNRLPPVPLNQVQGPQEPMLVAQRRNRRQARQSEVPAPERNLRPKPQQQPITKEESTRVYADQ